MRILGIDPSITSTGLAIIDDGQPVWRYHWGVAGHNTDTTVIRNRHIRTVVKHVRDVLATQQFDLAAIEGRAHGARFGNPGEREALRQSIISVLDVQKTPMAFVNPKTRALWATGNGNAGKPEVLKAVRSWWPTFGIHNDDEADAFVLALMAGQHEGWEMPFRMTNRHHAAMDKIEWPVRA